MSGALGMEGIFFSSGDSTMTASLVVIRELTLAASVRAVRTTCRHPDSHTLTTLHSKLHAL